MTFHSKWVSLPAFFTDIHICIFTLYILSYCILKSNKIVFLEYLNRIVRVDFNNIPSSVFLCDRKTKSIYFIYTYECYKQNISNSAANNPIYFAF